MEVFDVIIVVNILLVVKGVFEVYDVELAVKKVLGEVVVAAQGVEEFADDKIGVEEIVDDEEHTEAFEVRAVVVENVLGKFVVGVEEKVTELDSDDDNDVAVVVNEKVVLDAEWFDNVVFSFEEVISDAPGENEMDNVELDAVVVAGVDVVESVEKGKWAKKKKKKKKIAIVFIINIVICTLNISQNLLKRVVFVFL